MEINLLCHEVWLSNPSTAPSHEPDPEINSQHCLFSKKDEDDFDELGFKMFLEKESSFTSQRCYLHYIYSSNDLRIFRFRALRWLVKTFHRLNLSIGTIFNAANYFDRFVSKNDQFCHGGNWMVELLLVACLSIASKFNDSSVPSFSDLQMEGLEHSFQPSTISKMELTVSNALDWRLCSITSYSFTEMLKSNLKPHLLKQDLCNQVNKKLLTALLDSDFLAYPPSTVAISALLCGLEELFPSSFDANLTYFTRFFDQSQMDEMMKCHEMMKVRSLECLIPWTLSIMDERSADKSTTSIYMHKTCKRSERP